jgi:translation initiation factor 2 beta subunit (eIF-2beta)/eIF-5
MKFTPEQRELIKETRAKISEMQIEQSDLYANLLSELNLSERSEDWVFDYIFNQYGTIKNIENKSSKKS